MTGQPQLKTVLTGLFSSPPRIPQSVIICNDCMWQV